MRSRVSLLTVSLLTAVVLADTKSFTRKLNSGEKVIHALNRLTFGPRPGDVDAVKKTGLKKWLDLQLNPRMSPENAELESHLAKLDSLQMPVRSLVEHYPPPQLIAAFARRGAAGPMPQDPALRKRLERLAELYRMRRERGDKSGRPALPPVTDVLPREQLAKLRRGTPEERIAVLENLSDEQLFEVAIRFPGAGRGPAMESMPMPLRRRILAAAAPGQVIQHDLYEAKIMRAVMSNRQLEEVLVDFWFNHFNVYLDKGPDRFLVPSYERDAIRPHVLGKFKDLLKATAEHPAMLFYLDNWQSAAPPREGSRPRGRVRGLNENYARELLELHTLGVDGGYTQKDIVEVARCFTGWTIRDPRTAGGFVFNERMHDKGEKVVLGVTIPAGGGQNDGLKVLDILVKHPSTARYISFRLAQRFVADQPPPALVERMAKRFRETDGDLKQVMRTMLDSKEFWSEGAFRAKMKTPLELVASAVRAVGADVQSAFALAQKIGELGQPLYRKQEPTGYSNSSEEWVNSAALLGRMNFALALTSNKVPGVKMTAGQKPSIEDILRVRPGPATQAAIQASGDKPADSVIALALGSPEFQRR